MDERRDEQPPPVTRPPVIASTASRLSPLQEAWSAYVGHATHCPKCRSRDAGRCDTAEQLYRAYDEQGDSATRRLADGS